MDAQSFAQIDRFVAAVLYRWVFQVGWVFLLVELDELDICCLFSEHLLGSADEFAVVGRPHFGHLHNGHLGELLDQTLPVLGVLAVPGLHKLVLQKLLEEQTDDEDVEEWRHVEASNGHDADFGHVDGEFEDEVGHGHDGVVENHAQVFRHGGPALTDEGVGVEKLVEEILLLGVDVPAVLDEAGGEAGVAGNDAVDNIELADDVADELVAGERDGVPPL